MNNADMPAQPLPNGADGRPFVYMNGEHHMPGHAFGLTKREELAARAMQGLCAQEGYEGPQEIARDAVDRADALLAELEKEPNQ